MAINVDGITKFITENGNKFQREYYRCLFGAKNLPMVIKFLSEYQNKDGGWYKLDPDYTGTASSITCAMQGLAKYERLSISDAVGIERTIKYLKSVQKSRGNWDESNQVLDDNVPAWYYPHILNNQIWFTNGITRYIVSRKPEEVEMIEKARGYLRTQWTKEGFPGYDHNDWMAIVTFHGSEDELDIEIYSTCLNNIRNNIGNYDIADVAWALESFVHLRMPKTEEAVQKAISILKSAQTEDGGFGTTYGSLQRVDVTIEAVDSLANYNEFPRYINF